MVLESQRYAEQEGRMGFHTSMEEMTAFIGLLIIMSFTKANEFRIYWQRPFGSPIISQTTSRDRFEELLRNLHFVDNDNVPLPGTANFDPLNKVRPIIDKLKETFAAA